MKWIPRNLRKLELNLCYNKLEENKDDYLKWIGEGVKLLPCNLNLELDLIGNLIEDGDI